MKETKITRIAISGGYRSGKDTLGTKLVNQAGFTRLAFADILKAIAADQYPEVLEADKTDAARKILCQIGLEKNNNQCYTTYRLARFARQFEKVVITDLRFLEELDYCLLNGYKIVYLGNNQDGYDLEAIYQKADLLLPARPDITADLLLDKLK